MNRYNQLNTITLDSKDEWCLKLITKRVPSSGDNDDGVVAGNVQTWKQIDNIDDQHKKLYGCIDNVTVPSDVHLTLMNKNIIPDLYIGEKELEYRWITLSDWEYSRKFIIEKKQLQENERVVLVLEGVDTVASISINSHVVGNVNNMFRVYKFDIKPHLVEGQNELVVQIKSPAVYASEMAKRNNYEIPLWEYPNGVHHRNFIRKCGCHFGWDWGPAFAPLGIYKSVSLLLYPNDRPILEHISITQKYPSSSDTSYKTQSNLSLLIDIDIYNNQNNQNTLIIKIDGKEQKSFQLPALKNGMISQIKNLNVDLTNMNLWYPNGYGKAHLYTLDVEVNGQLLHSRKIGFRNIDIDTTEGAFTIKVNGLPIFAKGADWIPADHFLNRITYDHLDHLLTSAADANMNCLRVWGGGIYESDDFYDICDRLGILIWQDFMFACCLYPSDREFLDNVKQEVIDQVKRIDHHACLALWCGNNENEQALNVWKPSKENPPTYIIDYNRLYIETIMDTLQQVSPSRFYWPSSPSNGVNLWGDTNDQSRGDTHYWEVWHSNKPFTQYLKAKSRFLSEFGFQSLPSYSNLEKVLSSDQQLNITSPEMESRQRSPTPGNLGLLQHTALHFRVPASFEMLCWTTQILQAISIKTGCEHWRRMSPYCMGTLYWQLNDIWVGPSWSSIEYQGKWKALQYFAKQFYNPLLVSLVDNESTNQMEVWLTNDDPIVPLVTGKLFIQVWNVNNGVLSKQYTVEKAESKASSNACIWKMDKNELIKPNNLDKEFIYVWFEQSSPSSSSSSFKLENSYFLVPYKKYNLKNPHITFNVQKPSSSGGSYQLDIQSKEIALFVWIECVNNPSGTFSKNGFHIVNSVDKSIQIEFKPSSNNNEQPIFKIISLYDSYQNN